MQRTSYNQPRFCQQYGNALRNVGVIVTFLFARDKNNVVSRRNVWHMVRYRRFQLAANPIAVYGIAELFANRKPHLRLRIVAFAIQHYKVFVGNALGVFVHVVILIVLFKSILRLQGSLPVMRKENDDPCFFFLQEFCDRRSFSFWL